MLNHFGMDDEVKHPSCLSQEFFADVIRHHASDAKAQVISYAFKPVIIFARRCSEWKSTFPQS